MLWKILAAVAVLLALLGITVWIADPLRDRDIVFSTGASTGAYYGFAEEYLPYVEANGISMSVLEGAGSVETIERLKSGAADAGFVQGGLAEEYGGEGMTTLGSMFLEPLWILQRGNRDLRSAADMKGLRIGVGEDGSGGQLVAMRFLKEGGVVDSNATLHRVSNSEALTMLQNGELDVAFTVASPRAPIIEDFLRVPGVKLVDLENAAAYAAHTDEMTVVEIPQGLVNIRDNLPDRSVQALAVTANLVVSPDLHPDLQRLLVYIATQVHSGKGMLEEPGEFPSMTMTDWPRNQQAAEYYSAGPQWYDTWLLFVYAGPMYRLLRVAIPLFLVWTVVQGLIPLYRSYLDRKTTQYYGYLAVVERNSESMNSEQLENAIKEVEQIESGLIRVKLPPAYMPKIYAARSHTGMVLGRLRARRAEVSKDFPDQDGERDGDGDGDGEGSESEGEIAEDS